MTSTTTELELKQGSLVGWMKAYRPPFHTVGVFPFILGAVVASAAGSKLNWWVLVLGSLAVMLIMGMTYTINEYFDFETDLINLEYNKFSGGSRVLPHGLLSRRQVFIAGIINMLLALAIGFVLVFYFRTGPWTLPLGIIGILAGFFYTAKPVQLAYRGVGEIFIGFSYGWLPVLTGYYLQSGKFSLLAALISFPIAISIFEVIFINELPDYGSDKVSSKNNLVVKMGLEKSALVYNLLLVLTFISIIPAFFFQLSLIALVFLAFPFALGIWNFIEVALGGWRNKHQLEGICARTIGINLLITISLIVTFLWKGLT